MIPRNTSSLLDKIKNATGKKPAKAKEKETPVVETPEKIIDGGSNAGREAAKLRQRAKKAEADLLTITTERDALKAEVETLRGPAKSWADHEHIERTKLVAQLPPELHKEVKGMQLNHLRLFVNKQTGGEKGTKKETETTPTNDLLELQKSGDKKAINEYVQKVKSGEIIPVQPKPAEKAAA